MKKNILIVLTATAGLLASCVQTNEKIVPVGLRTEYLENPIGIDAKMPRFTWKYAGEDRRLSLLVMKFGSEHHRQI